MKKMKKILLVIDVQNGFVRTPEVNNTVEKIQTLLDSGEFDFIIATRFLNDSNSTFETQLGWYRLKTTEEQDLDPRIEKYADYVLDKYVYNCVNQSFIQKIIQLNDGHYPEELYLVGLDTDCCVLTSAVALFESGIRPLVLVDFCNSNGGQKSHEAGIFCLKRLIGEDQLINKVALKVAQE